MNSNALPAMEMRVAGGALLVGVVLGAVAVSDAPGGLYAKGRCWLTPSPYWCATAPSRSVGFKETTRAAPAPPAKREEVPPPGSRPVPLAKPLAPSSPEPVKRDASSIFVGEVEGQQLWPPLAAVRCLRRDGTRGLCAEISVRRWAPRYVER